MPIDPDNDKTDGPKKTSCSPKVLERLAVDWTLCALTILTLLTVVLTTLAGIKSVVIILF